MRKYRHLLEDRLLPGAREGPRTFGSSRRCLRQFRQSWKDGPLYATKNLERLRAFFRFCHQAGWIKRTPRLREAAEGDTQPTLPFSRDEMKRILEACDQYGETRNVSGLSSLTMRYHGPSHWRCDSAVKEPGLGRESFRSHCKDRSTCHSSVPPEVVKALAKIENGSDRYFWTGKNIRSAVSNWSRYLASVFELAEIDSGTRIGSATPARWSFFSRARR